MMSTRNSPSKPCPGRLGGYHVGTLLFALAALLVPGSAISTEQHLGLGNDKVNVVVVGSRSDVLALKNAKMSSDLGSKSTIPRQAHEFFVAHDGRAVQVVVNWAVFDEEANSFKNDIGFDAAVFVGNAKDAAQTVNDNIEKMRTNSKPFKTADYLNLDGTVPVQVLAVDTRDVHGEVADEDSYQNVAEQLRMLAFEQYNSSLKENVEEIFSEVVRVHYRTKTIQQNGGRWIYGTEWIKNSWIYGTQLASAGYEWWSNRN